MEQLSSKTFQRLLDLPKHTYMFMMLLISLLCSYIPKMRRKVKTVIHKIVSQRHGYTSYMANNYINAIQWWPFL